MEEHKVSVVAIYLYTGPSTLQCCQPNWKCSFS